MRSIQDQNWTIHIIYNIKRIWIWKSEWWSFVVSLVTKDDKTCIISRFPTQTEAKEYIDELFSAINN